MSLTVIRNADHLVCMDDRRQEIANGAIAFRNGVIEAVGRTGHCAALIEEADTVIDARGCVVTPGLVNTHHHLFQSLTRSLPGAINAPLFDWLKCLYPIWAQYRPEDVFAATQLGLAELALSGCTLTSDHLYLFPDGVTLDDTIAAAQGIGIRFHPTRGSMSVGESNGGLPSRTPRLAVARTATRRLGIENSPSRERRLAPGGVRGSRPGWRARRRGARRTRHPRRGAASGSRPPPPGRRP